MKIRTNPTGRASRRGVACCQKPYAPGRAAELAFGCVVERVAEVCWEATRAHVRAEFDSSTAVDERVPRKWIDAGPAAQAETRSQVMRWWAGEVVEPGASAIRQVCWGIVQAYKAVGR